ncbi:cytochrome P450 [Saccharopolyspora hirsuta]|uniref:Cytochrome P450 n=1 Tax=Saccharopolyspora hirsuta TaxID=1837 RepID=A0A5M7BRA4_SACHI|nr:cytochrome P450 [Saccharopolyspora hirsuta]KAA5830678.1 cytochrome P450 [Saccharopolyspora hirsuta]
MTEALPEPVVHPTTRSCPFDPHDGLRELREERPLARMHCPGGRRGWLVTSHALVREVLVDPRFGTGLELQFFPKIPEVELPPPAGMFSVLDPPEHTWYRRKLASWFSARRMRVLEARVEQLVGERLAAMRRTGGPTDLVTSFAAPLTDEVIGELLGIRLADEAGFRRVAERMLVLDGEPGIAEWEQLCQVVAEFVRDKAERPGDDLLSALVADDELTTDEVITMGVLLVTGAKDTTTTTFALGTYALLVNPDQFAALRADPSLAEAAVEELLRYLTILQFGVIRVALADVELHGETIRRGDLVTLSLSAANRDPAQFPDPDRLDVSRSTNGHVAFGHGVHHCLGAQLARTVLRIGFSGLARELPGLRLAGSPDQISIRDDTVNYGVRSLPVDWD